MSDQIPPPQRCDAPSFVDTRLEHAVRAPDNQWHVDSTYCDTFGHWSYSRAAAMTTAQAMGVEVVRAIVSDQPKGLVVQSIVARDKRTLFDQPGVKEGFEEEGGPGLEACFDFIDQHSSAPIVDVQALLRWAIVSYIMGHTEQHAGHVVLMRGLQADGSDSDDSTGHADAEHHGDWRLAPFMWMTTFAAQASHIPYPLPLGMKIGISWADDFLMVHQLVTLAKWARVKPKIVFSMANDVATRLPGVLKQALNREYRSTRNTTAEGLVSATHNRAQRVRDLCLAAPFQGVTGMKKTLVDHSSEGGSRWDADDEEKRTAGGIVSDAESTTPRKYRTIVRYDLE